MKLQAIFWDYPKFTNKKNLSNILKKNKDSQIYLWILNRFLEYGRVVDTFYFFDINEIANNLNKLKLTDYSQKKWNRLIEIYHTHKGK